MQEGSQLIHDKKELFVSARKTHSRNTFMCMILFVANGYDYVRGYVPTHACSGRLAVRR